MNNSDLILHLVEQLLAEKEKNFILQHTQQEMQNNSQAKTNRSNT